MLPYTPAQLSVARARAIRERLKLRATPDPLRYRATSSKTPAGPYVYDQRVGGDLESAECTCAAGQLGRQCDHAAAAISAARKARAHQAALTLAQQSIWARQLAAVAA